MEGNFEHVTPTLIVEKKGPKSKNSSGQDTKKGEAIKVNVPDREKVSINLQSLLQAGAHFGHQTTRWCPAMAPYIYTSRNGIHIINLPRTIQSWETAKKVIEGVILKGGNVLFVGTKKQAQEAIVEEATRCGAFYVSRRWLGGMLTNFSTIRKSIERMNKVTAIINEDEAAQAAGQPQKYTKKERLMMSKEREKLEYSLGGIKDMYSAPQLIFIIDIKREDIAVKEAKRLDIPVIALVDTNCDPRNVNYAIPSNDDGTRVVRLFCAAVADAIIEAKEKRPTEVHEKKHYDKHVDFKDAKIASEETKPEVAKEADSSSEEQKIS
ncbi:MAG: 30S ribosomal protein S2 [Proteobacteria bacterium]|nr:30S ribosomal protein S2 [Pseudomonadota bacterium]